MKKFLCIAWFIALTGCNVINSYRVTGDDAKEPTQNASGAYFLPKHLVVATIDSTGIVVESKAVQDRTTLLQVGLKLSGLSHDTITVAYKDGLLSKVTSIADDQTGAVLTELAQAAGRFRTNINPKDDKEIPFVIEFDPFDQDESEMANNIIGNKFPGTCVEVELVPGSWSRGCGPRSLESLLVDLPDPEELRDTIKSVEPGIYYKRSLDHRVHIVFKRKSVGLHTLKFANIAPVFRIDVNRTTFVKRKTEIDFEDGELTSVMVDKPSEVLGFAKLPVTLANAYISGVVDAFAQRKSVQEARASLMNQQAATLKAEQSLIEAQIAAANNANSPQERSAALASISRSTNFQNGGANSGSANRITYRSLQNLKDCQRVLEKTEAQCIETFRILNTNGQD